MSCFPVCRALPPSDCMIRYVLEYYALASIGKQCTLRVYTRIPDQHFSVILYYDHLLTFPAEVQRIWTRRLTLSSILFLVNRYVVFGGYIFVLYIEFFPPKSIEVSPSLLISTSKTIKCFVLRLVVSPITR